MPLLLFLQIVFYKTANVIFFIKLDNITKSSILVEISNLLISHYHCFGVISTYIIAQQYFMHLIRYMLKPTIAMLIPLPFVKWELCHMRSHDY